VLRSQRSPLLKTLKRQLCSTKDFAFSPGENGKNKIHVIFLFAHIGIIKLKLNDRSSSISMGSDFQVNLIYFFVRKKLGESIPMMILIELWCYM
jgi:hypothetical protein